MFASNNNQVKTFMSVRIIATPSAAVIATGIPALDKPFSNINAAKEFIIQSFYQVSNRLN